MKLCFLYMLTNKYVYISKYLSHLQIPYEKVGHTLDLYDDELHKRFADSPKDDGTSYGQIFDEIHKKVMDLHKESLSEEDRELYEAVFM